MVVREQFLAGLIQASDGYRARWEPVFAGAVHARLLKLASAMPHQCRAVVFDSASPPAAGSVSALSDFISYAVDYLVRTAPAAAMERPDARKGSSKAAKATHQSIHDQWIEALSANDGAMKAEPAEAEGLARQIAE